MNFFASHYSQLSDYQNLCKANLSVEQISQIIQGQKHFFSFPNACYEDKQLQSLLIDQIYGFNIKEVEQGIARNASEFYGDYEVWAGLNPRQLQTPYDELVDVLKICQLGAGDTLMDLGAGYGRAGVILGEHFKDSHFLGLEVTRERVIEGNRIFKKFGHTNSRLIAAAAHEYCVTEHPASIYFLYDFGHPTQLEQTLQELVQIAFKEPFYLVARGRGVRSIIDYKFPQFWSAFSAYHGETFSIYSTFCDVTTIVQSP